MLALERRNEILTKLLLEGKVIVSDLSKVYQVTEETIRRDLEKLENDGFAVKTYGGAIRSENMGLDVPYIVRKQTNVAGKQRIASLIGAMVEDGDSLMLDASSTALYVVKSILAKQRITLITNSIEILLELVNKPEWRVISTGGVLKEGGLSLLGYQAEKTARSFHVDWAICSCKGLEREMGITDSNEKDAEIKKAFFQAAERKVLAVDHTKFDKISFIRIAGYQDVDLVVTDIAPSEEWQSTFDDAGIQLAYTAEV